MYLKHKDWLKVPLFLEELKGLFEELSDEELDNLKILASEASKSFSDRATSNVNYNTGTNVRG